MICQNCKNDFTIEPDDFSFYEKINVPSPTFCPECRMIRRMVWRNVRSLNRRECGLCHKVLISMYSDKEAPVYCTECWSSDKWDQFATGVDYNFSENFFIQFSRLLHKAPRFFNYRSGNLINSDFTNYSVDNKNVYLSFSTIENEEVMYSETIDKSKNCLDCEYFVIGRNCSNCFGCVGLTNAKYCILNKQYEKEEYFKMVEKIKNHINENPYIDTKGRVFKYGEFFPYNLSPFGYNETNAHDFFMISKEEAISKGYNWKEKEKRDYNITIKSNDLPDSIQEVKDEILTEIIGCPNEGNCDFQCTTAYKIVAEELNFYRQKNLPLPRYCPNCRHYNRLKYRNKMKLYHRTCMREGCSNEFETTYSINNPEVVYCEKCYQNEVS